MIRRQSKYRAVKTAGYDSKKEYLHAMKLKTLEKAGKISNLQQQVRFELLPKQQDDKGRCIFRAINYIADFVFTDEQGKKHVQDVKGMKTKEFIIKEKLFYYKYRQKIEII